MRLEKEHSVECPDCGCNATRLIGAGGVFPRVWARFECGFCGRQFSIGEDATEPRTVNGVAYSNIHCRCPKCEAPNPTVTSTQGRIRYHKCGNCGQTFKSVEAKPA